MAEEHPTRVVLSPQEVDEIVRRVIQEQFWKRMAERQVADGPVGEKKDSRRPANHPDPLAAKVIVEVGGDGFVRLELPVGKRRAGKKVTVTVEEIAGVTTHLAAAL